MMDSSRDDKAYLLNCIGRNRNVSHNISVDELFFFAFGIMPEEAKEKGVNAAADKACLDLCGTIAYRLRSTDLKNKTDDFKALKKNFVEEVKDAISDSITGYASFDCSSVEVPAVLPSDMRPFDLWHYCLTKRIEGIVDAYNKKHLFKPEQTFSCWQI